MLATSWPGEAKQLKAKRKPAGFLFGILMPEQEKRPGRTLVHSEAHAEQHANSPQLCLTA